MIRDGRLDTIVVARNDRDLAIIIVLGDGREIGGVLMPMLVMIFVMIIVVMVILIVIMIMIVVVVIVRLGGVVGLVLSGIPFSVSAAIGFIALFGIAVMDGIIILSQFNQLIDEGVDRIEAVIRTARHASGLPD